MVEFNNDGVITDHKRALVLNVDYSPMNLVRWQKAIVLEFKGLVDVIDFYANDKIICADGTKWPAPAVLRCRKYKKHSRGRVPFSKKNVFLRDRLTCQYCGIQLHFSKLTFDHVYPKSKHKRNNKGQKTPTHWENIVTCCRPCNHKKAHHTLEESGMTLIKKPYKPLPHVFVKGIAPWTILSREWLPYLPKFYLEICSVY